MRLFFDFFPWMQVFTYFFLLQLYRINIKNAREKPFWFQVPKFFERVVKSFGEKSKHMHDKNHTPSQLSLISQLSLNIKSKKKKETGQKIEDNLQLTCEKY